MVAPKHELEALHREIARLQGRLASVQSEATAQTQRLQAVVDAAPLAIVLLDEAGSIVFTNAGARELFFDDQSPEGRNFLRMLTAVPGPLKSALLSESDHIFNAGGAGEAETYHVAKRHLQLAQQLHTVLLVRPMTLELSRRENDVLRRALRVIHHEFANSLAPVLSLLRSARSRLLSPESNVKLDQVLGVIEERVLHLNSFLSGFAALARLPKPRPQELEWEPFLNQLRPLLADITIGPPPPGWGWFDPAQLQQIIFNLVKNAREADSAPADIVLEVAEAPEGGQRVSVLDRGSGMSDSVLENAVVPSFTTKAGGSGIGLALCREIADAHGGRLRIARREGGGTSVSVWLPPRETPADAAALTMSRARLSLSRDAESPGA